MTIVHGTSWPWEAPLPGWQCPGRPRVVVVAIERGSAIPAEERGPVPRAWHPGPQLCPSLPTGRYPGSRLTCSRGKGGRCSLHAVGDRGSPSTRCGPLCGLCLQQAPPLLESVPPSLTTHDEGSILCSWRPPPEDPSRLALGFLITALLALGWEVEGRPCPCPHRSPRLALSCHLLILPATPWGGRWLRQAACLRA